MTVDRPGVLAARAVNQYRRRDIIPYLGLRYFLANKCAVRDRWAEEVAIHLFETRSRGNYFLAYQFKEQKQNGVDYREIHLPTPVEALVEAVVLNACSRSRVFDVSHPVYSYQLPSPSFRGGMFCPYFPGFKERHAAITAVCQKNPDVQVTFTDIRRFYPSVRPDVAESAWAQASHQANIRPKLRELGDRILLDHRAEAPSARALGLLTGPMFSHLIGNLVLKTVDDRMVGQESASYFRYVDDIALVGTATQVANARSTLVNLLGDLGLELHPDKELTVTASEWVRSKDDFLGEEEEPSWMSFVGSLKQFLLQRPDVREELQQAFFEQGMRIPLLDYSQTAIERTFAESFRFWAGTRWFRRLVSRHTMAGLLNDARILRLRYASTIKLGLQEIGRLNGFDKKRLIPKLRYAAGRLLYVGDTTNLVELSSTLMRVPELILLGRVFQAVGTRDVSSLLNFGTNAAQAAAQVLRLDHSNVLCPATVSNEQEMQALAILKLNGVNLSRTNSGTTLPEGILGFADWQGRDRTLLTSPQPFIRELACLHGVDEQRRNDFIIDSAFDRDDSLAFDAISMLQGYS